MSRLHDEEGAVAAMVIMGIAALLAAALIAIDVGSMLHTRRGLIADTDAAALAAAMALLEDDCDVAAAQGEAREIAATNDPETTVAFPPSADVCGDGYGHVTVATTNPAQLFFAPFFGTNEVSAGATSTAAYGQIISLERLRPIGLCSGDVLTPQLSPETYSGATEPVQRFRFVRTGSLSPPPACGAASANWGWLNLDGGNKGNPNLEKYIEEGYPGTITLNGSMIGGNPGGRGNSTDDALDEIRCDSSDLAAGAQGCPIFYVVVYDQLTRHGATAEFRPVAFLGVVLRDYGAIGTGQTSGWLDFEVIDELTSGSIGPANPAFPLGLRGVQLCATEHSTRPC